MNAVAISAAAKKPKISGHVPIEHGAGSDGRECEQQLQNPLWRTVGQGAGDKSRKAERHWQTIPYQSRVVRLRVIPGGAERRQHYADEQKRVGPRLAPIGKRIVIPSTPTVQHEVKSEHADDQKRQIRKHIRCMRQPKPCALICIVVIRLRLSEGRQQPRGEPRRYQSAEREQINACNRGFFSFAR